MDNEKAIIDQLHHDAAILLRQHKTDEEIIQALVKQGTDRHYAAIILNNLRNDHLNKKKFRNTLLAGLGILIMGLLLNVASYRFSLKGGMLFFYVFLGVVVTGISIIARAFILYRK